MGYTTDFTSEFELDRPLEDAHREYLAKFSSTRRMARHAHIVEGYDDPIRVAAGLPLGEQAAYYVGDVGADFFNGANDPASIVNFNGPPTGQPGLWCQWVPNEDGSAIVWDEGEKFYEYVEWLKYLIAHFIKPWGYVLNGSVNWQGEDSEDRGCLIVEDNRVGTSYGVSDFAPTQWEDGEVDPDPKLELMTKLNESLKHVGENLESIDKAMRNDAVPGAVAQAAWACACRHLEEAKGHASELQNILS